MTIIRERGLADFTSTDARLVAAGASLVVLATPVTVMESVSRLIIDRLAPDAVVTDVGSVKQSVVGALEPLFELARRSFVGSHPMAGSEKFGPEHANPDLYQGSITIVEPAPDAAPDARESVQALWKAVGSQVVELDPALHDALVKLADSKS